MLTDELLKVIQADRAREIEAAARVRSLRPSEAAETIEPSRQQTTRADLRSTSLPAHAGTAATDSGV